MQEASLLGYGNTASFTAVRSSKENRRLTAGPHAVTNLSDSLKNLSWEQISSHRTTAQIRCNVSGCGYERGNSAFNTGNFSSHPLRSSVCELDKQHVFSLACGCARTKS